MDMHLGLNGGCAPLAVVPILIGPLQVLLAVLPAILVAVGATLIAMLKPSSLKIVLQVLWRNKWATLVAMALVGAGIYGFSMIPASRQGQAGTFRGTAEWPMFRGGLERRGAPDGDTVAEPAGGGTVWSSAQTFKTYYSSPAIVGNRVVASAAKKEVFVDRGAISCVDAENGAVVWEFAPPDFRATFSSPSVAGKYVVCGEGLHLTRDARIVCLSFETGQKLWEVRTTSHVESSPCIAGDMAFCGAGADGVYALRLDTPAGQSPVVWHVKGIAGDKLFHCDSALAATDGRVYVTSSALHDGDWSGVACLDAATGETIWHVETPMPVWGSPTIVGDRLFVGMGNGNFVETAEQFWARKQEELRHRGMTPREIEALAPRYAAGGQLWALDVKSGNTLWTRKMRQTMLGCVAAADGRLFFAAMDGLFMCVTQDNELLAELDVHEGIKASPAVGRQYVYVVTDTGRLFGLDRRTLRPVWRTSLGEGDLFTSSPVVGGGHIYVGSPSRGLLCLGTPPERLPEPIWPGARGGAGRSGWLDGSTLPTKGSFAWRWPAEDTAAEGAATAPSGVAPAAFLDGTLYATVATPERTGLAALTVGGLSKEGGPLTRAPDTEKWFIETALPVQSAVASTTDRVYFVEGPAGEAARSLRCVSAAEGHDVWRVPVDADASGDLLLTPAQLFACVRAGRLSCLETEAAGRERWSAEVGRAAGPPCAAGDLVLVATADLGVTAIDTGTGGIRWRQTLPQPPVSGPVANDDVAVVATPEGLIGLSLENGGLLWHVPCAPSAAPLCADDDRVVAVTADGEIVAVAWSDTVAFRIPEASPDQPASLLGDTMLFVGRSGALQKAGLGREIAVERWMDAKWLGRLAAPPILGDGMVYFSTTEKGLIAAKPQGKR
jgi:outer membrane protein assembly factor BamB